VFTVSASEGIVLVQVDGFAVGLTNTELTRLIRNGLATVYPVQCDAPTDVASNVTQMVWHVINHARKPTALVTVNIIRNGGIIRSKFANVAAPGTMPAAVFRREVSELAYRVMPPATNAADPRLLGAARCRE
jgi:hypothetical protein